MKELTKEEINTVSSGFWVPVGLFLLKTVVGAYISIGVQRCTSGKKEG